MKKKIIIRKIKNFFKWIWRECKDKNTLLLFIGVVVVMYLPVWGGYLFHVMFGWAWCSAVASAYLLFWCRLPRKTQKTDKQNAKTPPENADK